MKRLKIVYGEQVLFDADVSEMTWTDNAGGVRVEGKARPGGGGFMDVIAGLSKAKAEGGREVVS